MWFWGVGPIGEKKTSKNQTIGKGQNWDKKKTKQLGGKRRAALDFIGERLKTKKV